MSVRSVTKQGATVEAAVKAALEELNVTEDKVEYVVLEEPMRRFFGILSRQARVRVTVKDEEIDNMLASLTAQSEKPAAPLPPDSHDDEAKESISSALTQEEPQKPAAPALRTPHREEDGTVAKTEEFLGKVFAAMDIEARAEYRRRGERDGYAFDIVGDRLGILIGKHGQTLDALQYLTNLAVNHGEVDERVRIVLDVEDYRRRRDDTLRQLALKLAERALYMNDEVRLEPMNRHERKIIHMALSGDRRVSTYSDGDDPYRCVVIVPRRHRRNYEYRPPRDSFRDDDMDKD